MSGGYQCPTGDRSTGGNVATIVLETANQDVVRRQAVATTVVIKPGSARVTGALGPGRTVTITLRDPVSQVLAKAHAWGRGDGTFATRFLDTVGQPVAVTAGDRVSGGLHGNIALTVPAMSFDPIPEYHRLDGYCMPNASKAMDVIWATGGSEAVGVTDPTAGRP